MTATEQSAGRGRQGRTWTAPPGRAVLASLIVRDPPQLLPLAVGVAVAEVVEESGDRGGAGGSGGVGESGGSDQAGASGEGARIKWPNDVLVAGRKVAGILVEGRPQEGWAVVGIGLNVAVRAQDFPPELRDRAGSLGLDPDDVEPVLERLLGRLERWIPAVADEVLAAVRARDALFDAPIRWGGGHGRGAGIDGSGRLIVATAGGRVTLEAGEVHLGVAVAPAD